MYGIGLLHDKSIFFDTDFTKGCPVTITMHKYSMGILPQYAFSCHE